MQKKSIQSFSDYLKKNNIFEKNEDLTPLYYEEEEENTDDETLENTEDSEDTEESDDDSIENTDTDTEDTEFEDESETEEDEEFSDDEDLEFSDEESEEETEEFSDNDEEFSEFGDDEETEEFSEFGDDNDDFSSTTQINDFSAPISEGNKIVFIYGGVNDFNAPSEPSADLLEKAKASLASYGETTDIKLYQLNLQPVSPTEPLDGMVQVYETIESADFIVFVSPLKKGAISSLIQTCMDRLSNHYQNMELKNKLFGTILCGSEDGYQQTKASLLNFANNIGLISGYHCNIFCCLEEGQGIETCEHSPEEELSNMLSCVQEIGDATKSIRTFIAASPITEMPIEEEPMNFGEFVDNVDDAENDINSSEEIISDETAFETEGEAELGLDSGMGESNDDIETASEEEVAQLESYLTYIRSKKVFEKKSNVSSKTKVLPLSKKDTIKTSNKKNPFSVKPTKGAGKPTKAKQTKKAKPVDGVKDTMKTTNAKNIFIQDPQISKVKPVNHSKILNTKSNKIAGHAEIDTKYFAHGKSKVKSKAKAKKTKPADPQNFADFLKKIK